MKWTNNMFNRLFSGNGPSAQKQAIRACLVAKKGSARSDRDESEDTSQQSTRRDEHKKQLKQSKY